MTLDGMVHCVNYYRKETYEGKLSCTEVRMICREIRQMGKEDPPVQLQGSEWTHLLSKSLLKGEPRCSWIQI